MPIWDAYVPKNFGLNYAKNRIEKIIAIYDSICLWYRTEDALKCVGEFNRLYPEIQMSDVKKS